MSPDAVVTIEDVRAAMLRTYPDDLPTWDDPHEHRSAPAQDEYSRVTDGERYRILIERARAWTNACIELLGVRVDQVPVDPDAEGSRGGWKLTSPRQGTTPLHVRVFHYDLDVLVLGCGPEDEVIRLPDCGCDACDSGSEVLLEAVDEWFVHALTGGLVHLWSDGWAATTEETGHSSSGSPEAVQIPWEELEPVFEAVRSGDRTGLPEGINALTSGRWVD